MKLSLPVLDLDDATRNFEQIQRQGLYSGVGAPAFQASEGDFYLRRDTPSTANQRVYVNTADGSNWTGIL